MRAGPAFASPAPPQHAALRQLSALRRGALRRAALIVAAALLLAGGAARAQEDGTTVYLDKRAALAAVFPQAARVVELKHLLSAAETAAIEALTGQRLEEGGFFLYAAFATPGADAAPTGYALIVAEIGKVRPITHIVSVTPDGTVGRVAVMIYRESHGADVASERFMEQYAGKSLADPLRINRDIINIAGSTLSGHAICRGVRKALAVVQVVLRDRAPADCAALLATGTDVTPGGAPPATRAPAAAGAVPAADTTRIERLAPGHLRAERSVMGSVCSIEAFTAGAADANGASGGEAGVSGEIPGNTAELAREEADLEAALRAALDEASRWDAVLSDWRPDTPLSRLNAAPAGEAQRLDPDLLAWLADSAQWHTATGGAFDPTVGALVAAWGLRTPAPARPTPGALERARAACGWDQFPLDVAAGTATRGSTGLRLDPGGSGKGWALDRAADVLRARGVSRALLSFTSTLLALDPPPGEAGWRVPVLDDDGRTLAEIPLARGALSVSGGGFSVFEDRGSAEATGATAGAAGADGSMGDASPAAVRRGHVLDPASGVPVEAARLAWVQHERAAGADALSTALLVRGAALPAVAGAQGTFVAGAGAAPEPWPAPLPAGAHP